MKTQRPYARATVTPKGEHALSKGHPWVYEAEVVSLEPTPGAADVPNGSIVDVVSRKGTYLGSGLLSLKSKIRIRLVTRNANDRFDCAFWKRKVQWAWSYRKTVMGRHLPGASGGACRGRHRHSRTLRAKRRLDPHPRGPFPDDGMVCRWECGRGGKP